MNPPSMFRCALFLMALISIYGGTVYTGNNYVRTVMSITLGGHYSGLLYNATYQIALITNSAAKNLIAADMRARNARVVNVYGQQFLNPGFIVSHDFSTIYICDNLAVYQLNITSGPISYETISFTSSVLAGRPLSM